MIVLILGLVYPLTFSPFGLPAIGLLAVAGFAVLLLNASLRSIFLLAYVFGLGIYGSGASWVYVSIHTYGQAPVALAVLMTTVFVAFLALCFALPFLLLGLSPRHRWSYAFIFPSIWVLSEWFRGWFLTGFPWLYLGHGHTDTWLAGWAPLGGVLTISWIGAFSAATAALIVGKVGDLTTRLALWALVIVLWGAGYPLSTVTWTTARDKPLSVAMIQPGASLEQKWDSASLGNILDHLSGQTEAVWGKDLIIWPESAIPRLLEDMRPFLITMDKLARQHGSTLITGIPTRYGPDTYNSVITLGMGEGIYHKQHLVPFGEYVPLETWLRGLIRFFDLPMSAFSSGNGGQSLIHANGHPIATAICYEIVYQDLVASAATNAELLLTVSNDTWFGSSWGPHQHFQIARMRAIENQKPLLRATNDGITAFIDSQGAISRQLPQFQPDTLTGEVVPRQGSTPFNHLGSWPVVAVSMLMIALANRIKQTVT